jgi:hypothetical protein
MCWCKSILMRGLVIGLFFASAGLARGESIRRLEHAPKKAAVKPKNNSFSPKGMSLGRDLEFDQHERFLLGGKKKPEPAKVVARKKKEPEPPIKWDDKHAKKVNAKGPKIKVPPKPAPKNPPRDVTVQWATPMAASAMESPASVPTPKAVWAGLGMIGALGICRWLAARRVAGD